MDTRRFGAVAWLAPVIHILPEEVVRSLCMAILVCVALGGCSGSRVGDGTPAEKAAIQAALDAQAKAWNKGDAAAVAAVMTDDADWVSADGSVYEGRDAIEAAHRGWFEGTAKGSFHSHPGLPKIHFVRSDVAIVDGDSYQSGLHDDQGKELPAETSRYTAIMVKEGGRWRVAAYRSLPQLKSKIDPADAR